MSSPGYAAPFRSGGQLDGMPSEGNPAPVIPGKPPGYTEGPTPNRGPSVPPGNPMVNPMIPTQRTMRSDNERTG